MNTLTEQLTGRLEVLEERAGGAFRFRGTALVQGGLSRNGRYYPPAVVAALVETTLPLPIYARHRHAVEGTALPVGRVDRLILEEGALRYEATLAGTREGQDIAALIRGGFLPGVSIRACPYTARRVRLGDREIERIESLTLRGLDFTDNPGVPEAAGFEILEEASLEPLEEDSMNLQSLNLETLRAERPDLVQAVRDETAALLEEIRRTLGAEDVAALPDAVRALARQRDREEIAALAETALAGDPACAAIKERLLAECATPAEARARLEKEREYAQALRRSILRPDLFRESPTGHGLVENNETAALTPERACARRLAGIC